MECTVYGLGCCSFPAAVLKTWRDYSIDWKCIPLDNSQWKERIFVVILASMNLMECHRVVISENPM